MRLMRQLNLEKSFSKISLFFLLLTCARWRLRKEPNSWRRSLRCNSPTPLPMSSSADPTRSQANIFPRRCQRQSGRISADRWPTFPRLNPREHNNATFHSFSPSYVKFFLRYAHLKFIIRLHVLILDQLVAIDATRLVEPQSNEIARLFDALARREENSLKDVRQIAQIENVVKLDGRRQERARHFRV